VGTGDVHAKPVHLRRSAVGERDLRVELGAVLLVAGHAAPITGISTREHREPDRQILMAAATESRDLFRSWPAGYRWHDRDA
jgi:hypothetical protein